MHRLYQKSELGFALVCIGVYVVGTSVADAVSDLLGVRKSVTCLWLLVLSLLAVRFLRRHNLFSRYGLCRSPFDAKRFLWYLPLVCMVSVNLWGGVGLLMPWTETALYIGSMLCVGFLEELIFRGFLFKAMQKDNKQAAIIVSSVTFGVGHIVNLINGSGADLLSNLLQIGYAMAAGFLFVVMFDKGKSLLPCIIAHGVLNALSAFSNGQTRGVGLQVVSAVFLCVIPLLYAYILWKILNGQKETNV